MRTQICVLGAGAKPLVDSNSLENFLGLEDVSDFEALNVDRIKSPFTNFLADLSEERWYLPSNKYDIVIAEHVIDLVFGR